MNLKEQLQDFLIREDEEYSKSRKQKDSFWASQCEAPLFDIYCQWQGIEPTNPMDAEKLVMFSAAKLMEVALINKLQKMGVVKKGDTQEHFTMEKEGILVSGYYDGVMTDGRPVEIKTMANDYQARELENGYPKSAYLKQLAIYIQSLDAESGVLVYLDRRDGKIFEFTLDRLSDSKFKCLNVEFDINDTYKRWSKLYHENVLKNKFPDVFEDCGKYKANIETLDWSKVSKSDISKARNGHKVIGTNQAEHWKILYSNWKNLWIKMQGSTPGYSQEELARIKELTKGFSSKR